MLKNKELKEGLQQLKHEKDEERKKMKEDIERKKREMMRKKADNDNGFKVEIVGVPDFMQPSTAPPQKEDNT